jgi:hypothetical protein
VKGSKLGGARESRIVGPAGTEGLLTSRNSHYGGVSHSSSRSYTACSSLSFQHQRISSASGVDRGSSGPTGRAHRPNAGDLSKTSPGKSPTSSHACRPPRYLEATFDDLPRRSGPDVPSGTYPNNGMAP